LAPIQAKRMPMLFSSPVGAAITAGYWFLWALCRGCRSTSAVDLRRVAAAAVGEQKSANKYR
jgi:hypothetical protein